MKKDDARFVVAVIVTLCLAVSAVVAVHRQNTENTVASAVDVSRLEKLADKGVISLHPADHWQSLDETERTSVDLEMIESKTRQGALSLHEAEHWEEVPGR